MSALYSCYFFTRNYFVSPVNPPPSYDLNLPPENRWNPYKNQIPIYNIVDFGYDVNSKVIKPPKPTEKLVIVFPRQCGKTECTASLIPALMLRHPGAQIGIMSNTQDNAEKFILRIRFFLEHSPFVGEIATAKTDRVYLKNGSRVFSFGQTENIRGNTLWWLFIDEAAQFTDKMLEGDAFPVVEAAGVHRKYKTPSIVLISTPAGQRGLFYKLYKQGLDGRQIGCRTCKTIFPKAKFNEHVKRWDRNHIPALPPCPHCGGKEYEYVDNKIAVIHPDPYDHPFKSEAQLREEVEEAGNTPLARQEKLGEFIAEGEGLFKQEWLEHSVDSTLHNAVSPLNINYTMSVDLGRTNDATVICIGHMDGRNEDSHRILDYIERHPGQGGQEYSVLRYWILRQIALWKPSILVLDATGMGDAVAEQVYYDIKRLKTIGVEGTYTVSDPSGRKKEIPFTIPKVQGLHTSMFSNKKDHYGFYIATKDKMELIESAIYDLSRGYCRIPARYIARDVTILWEELLNFAFEYSPSGKVIYGTQSDHDDCVMSYALLLWAQKVHPYVRAAPKLGESDEYVLSSVSE